MATKTPCTVCTSGLRLKVDQMLQDGLSVRDIQSETGISKSAIGRHRMTDWKGHPVKKEKAIIRTEDRIRSYEGAIQEESEKGTLIIEGEVSGESTSTGTAIVTFEPKTQIRCPIRDAEDIVGKQYEGVMKVWRVLEKSSEAYEADPSPGRARIVIMAAHEYNILLMAIGKVKGLVTDSPQTTNNTMNVYGAMTDEDLEKKKLEIQNIIALARSSGIEKE